MRRGSGFISVIDGKTGQPQWTFDAADDKYGIDPASVTVEPTIADLDGQLPKEVLFTTRYAPDDAGDDYGSFHMASLPSTRTRRPTRASSCGCASPTGRIR